MTLQEYPPLAALLDRYKTATLCTDAIRDVAALVLQTDDRFVGPDTWQGLRQRPPLRAAKVLEESPKLAKRITHDLVGIMHRPTDTLTVPVDGGAVQYIQRFGHVAGRPARCEIVWDQSLSSKAIKRASRPTNQFMLTHNANLGSVKVDGKLILLRSARSDTAARLEELLLFGAAQDSQCGPGKVVHYRAAIISGLDLCPIKSLLVQARGGESEAQVLCQIGEAIGRLFGRKKVITRRGVDGSLFKLERPYLMHLPFSAWARLPSNIERARLFNGPAMDDLYQQVASAWQNQVNSPAWEVGKMMAACATRGERLSWLRRCQPEKQKIPLDRNHILCLEGLKVMLTGVDSFGRSYLKAADPAKELLFLRFVLSEAQVVPHVQCLSGEDRSLTMGSIWMAADIFERQHGRQYDPRVIAGIAHEEDMQEYFRLACVEMGRSPICNVRGTRGNVKWNIERGALGHPVPQSMFERIRFKQ